VPAIGLGQAVTFCAKIRTKAAISPKPLWQALYKHHNQQRRVIMKNTFKLVLVALAFSSGIVHAGDKWEKSNKHSFCQKFQSGWEADGRKLFSSIAGHGTWEFEANVTILEDGSVHPGAGIPRQNVSWHIGKAGVHLKDGMTYSYGGKEKDSKKHYVFCPDNPAEYHWVAGSNGSYPAKAVNGWHSSENQKVCRANWGGGKHPGKLIPSSGACFIGYGGGEKAVKSYEVLVRK
tara:strand:- start:96 stop:794 length:699 start_codon:yes stop_codon:yes gene_type:complete